MGTIWRLPSVGAIIRLDGEKYVVLDADQTCWGDPSDAFGWVELERALPTGETVSWAPRASYVLRNAEIVG